MTPTSIALADLQSLIGRQLGPSEPVLIDQNKVDLFAQTTGDHQWVHVNVARANDELNGTIAHGYLILSLIPHYVSQLLHVEGVASALNYGVERVRFLSPVRPAAMLAGSLRLLSVETKAHGVLMAGEFSIQEIGAERPACVATTLTLLIPGEGRFGSFD